MVRAQLLQIKKDKDGDVKEIAKKASEYQTKINAAQELLEVFKSDVSLMKKLEWQDIIKLFFLGSRRMPRLPN